MLDIFDQNPQSRVFHVDRECYVVYLGSHWEDYKPFLRIGTSTDLPADLPPIVSTIVVPDVLTGNPLDEPACLAGDATPDTHYVGDVDTVEHMKEFVGQETIPVEAIEAIDHEEDDGKHVVVYYYKDGNLRIKYRKSEILDLRRRERLDAHFVARAQEAKNEYGRSPFKTPTAVYQRPGFVVAAGTPYLIARGELAALKLTAEYFFELSSAGIDADRITTVQAEDADTALIRFFKRSRTKGRTIRVSSPRVERIKQAASLFPENSLPALKIKVTDGKGGAFDFHGYSVTQAPGRFEAVLEELGGAVVFGSAAKKRGDAPIMVDPTAGTIVLGESRVAEPLLEGTVYSVAAERLTRTAIEERYLPEKSYHYRDLLSQAENTLLDQLRYFLAELFGGRDTGKVLRTIRNLDPVKALGKADSGIHPIVQIYLHNYKQYLRFLRASEPDVAKGAEALASLLDRHEVTRADVPAMLPLVGEVHHGDGASYLFYALAQRVTSDRYAHAERVVEKINAVPVVDFESERKRLMDLIAGLATPEQMDEARLRRIARQQEKKKRAATEAAGAESESEREGESTEAGPRDAGEGRRARAGRKPVRDRSAAAPERAGGRAGSGRAPAGARGRGRHRPRRWIVPTSLAVLAIAALIALLLTGIIPNPWFADGTPVAAADDEAEQREGEAAEPDAAEPDADQTAPDGTPSEGDAAEDDNGPADEEADEEADEPPAEDTTDGDEPAEPLAEGTAAEGESDDRPDAEGDAAEEDTGPTDDDADEPPAEEPEDVVELPEGWPPDSLPALRALEETPGVVITPEQVTGPGGIEITLRDIIDLVNQIATENGYAPMDVVDPDRPDPDWIYPGNVFVLPNGTRYTVVEGDTLWEITVRYMVARLRQDYERYTQLVSEYESLDTSAARREEIVQILREIGEESHTENFSRLVEETLGRWEE